MHQERHGGIPVEALVQAGWYKNDPELCEIYDKDYEQDLKWCIEKHYKESVEYWHYKALQALSVHEKANETLY